MGGGENPRWGIRREGKNPSLGLAPWDQVYNGTLPEAQTQSPQRSDGTSTSDAGWLAGWLGTRVNWRPKLCVKRSCVKSLSQ